MESSDESGELSPSDLEIAVLTIRSRSGLVGYRNLLSYTSALGIKVFSETSVNMNSWTRLGSGAYSTTWKAETDGQPGGGRVVAIKQPNASFTRESAELEDDLQHEALTRIIQELRVLAHPRLRAHPNLPHILGVFFREEERPHGIRPCVIFDLAVSDLKKYLVARQPQDIPPRDRVRLCSNVADGICSLHACGLVHGDIKPENVLLFMREEVLTAAVGDLDTCAVPTRNQGGAINGTVRYAPPEYQSRSPYREHVNRPSRDVYNYGLLVWSISTGCARHPFPPDLQSQYDLQHDDEAAMRYLLDALPGGPTVPSLYELINLCVRSDPELRPTMFEVARLLDPTSGNR
jgi:serine/threonine protein kinase